MGEILLQLFGAQLQKLKKEYASLLGMFFASAFFAKWLDPYMLKYIDKAWTLIEKKEYIKSAPEIIYIISLLGAAWGTLGCYNFLALLFFEEISGNNHFVARQTSFNRLNHGYLLAVVGFSIFAFFELDGYLIRCINVVRAHPMMIFIPFIFNYGLLGMAIFHQFMPQRRNETWRGVMITILFWMLLSFLMDFYLKIPGLDVLAKYTQ